MYMRPRGSGIPRPQRPSMRPEYQDFRPISSWKQEQGSHVLLVFLPGFMREQVKITVETSNTVKVSGQRPLGNYIWSRFNQDFNIPEDCNIGAISAKFDNGTLTITMPKKIVDSPQVGPEVKAETTQDAPLPPQKAGDDDKPKSQTSNQQRDEKIAQIPSPPKATSTMTGMGFEEQRDEKSTGPPSPQKAAVEPKSQKGQEELPPKATPAMKEELPPKATSAMTGIEKQRDEKTTTGSPNTQNAAIEPKPQKGQEEILPPKATSTVSGEKQDKEGIKAPISPQKPVSEPKAQKDEGKSTSPASTSKQTDGKIVGSTTDENVVQKAMEKKERIKTIKKAPGEKERESSEKKKGSMAAKALDPGFVKTEETAASGFNLEKYMTALKDLPMKIREDRQSVVNMGAAIAVIVALGAYIFYFGPSGKARN